jgi:two-component system sensor kinase FixL
MQASAPVVTLDAHSIILAISQPACALFRTAEREATGRPFQDFVEFFDAGVVRSSPPGEYSADQYWLGRRADGDVFPLGIQLAFVTGDPGTSEAILTLTDLSLWHSAELRSQELSDQLNQVWRMNSLGEMAAILSHELNQPLTAAASYLQASQVDLGRAGIMADNASRTVELAKSQVLRAGAIIRRARELLTVETQPLEPERMSSMIDDLGPIIQLLGPASDAGIQISIDNIDDRVMADRIQFQQAIVNLVRNAVEAVADRERREVRLIGRPTSAEFYEIRVEDSGPGLAPDQVERMFEPLMTTKSDGMGLGLSVTRTIVENHGGSLTVGRSEMGGAAFTFSLQRVKEEPIL